MQHGKFLVKTKQSKVHRKDFERQEANREHDRMKHHDKALLRSKRQEQREDYDGFPVDDGY